MKCLGCGLPMEVSEMGVNFKGEKVEYHGFQAKCVELLREKLYAVNLQVEDLKATIQAEALRAKMLATVHQVALDQNDKLRDVLEMWDGHLPTMILNPQANYELIVPAQKVKALRDAI